MEHYDLIAIGGGSAGLAASIRAAEYGAKVAVIESSKLGGTCVHRGCVPKKLMWYACHYHEAWQHAAGFGWQTNHQADLNWQRLITNRESYLNRIEQSFLNRLKKLDITLISGQAMLYPNRTVEVHGHLSLQSKHVLISTGSKPIVPDLPGAELGITSDGFFRLSQQPARVGIVGSGYIGIELAGVLAHLGSQVSCFWRHQWPLRHFDDMLGQHLGELMTQQGIHLYQHTNIAALQQIDQHIWVQLTNRDKLVGPFDQFIWAIGREPNPPNDSQLSQPLRKSATGFIEVDQYDQSSEPEVYAVGDVIDHPALTPLAVAKGRRLADRLFGGQPDAIWSSPWVPTVVFSHPPIGTVGLSEQAAIEQYGLVSLTIYESQFKPMQEAFYQAPSLSKMKIICHGAEQRVIGMHVIGHGADEMLQGFAAAMQAGLTKQHLDNTLAIHPTSSEELVTMRHPREKQP